MRRLLPAALTLLAGCSARALPPSSQALVAESSIAAPTVVVGAAAPAHGVGHYDEIVATAVSRDGTAALSRDAGGGLRLWTRLDGTAEPLPVNIPDVVAMQVDRSADGLIAALVDRSGHGHLVRFNAGGAVVDHVTLGGEPSWSALALLPGGQRALGVRTDHQLVALGADGAEHARLALGRLLVLDIHALDDRRALVVTDDGAKAPRYQARRLALTGDDLAWDGDAIDLEGVLDGDGHTALSPDATHLAYVGRFPEAIMRPVVLDLTNGGVEQRIPRPELGDPRALHTGWLDDDTVTMTARNGVSHRFELAGNAQVFQIEHPLLSSPHAHGRGVMVAGASGWLAVDDGAGHARYLGYRELSPFAPAFTPSGAAVAWATSNGAIVLQPLHGDDPLRHYASRRERYHHLTMVDERVVLATAGGGTVDLIDLVDGRQLASMVVDQRVNPFVLYDGASRLAAMRREDGAVWVIRVDPGAATPLSTPIVLADRARSIAWLEPAPGEGALLRTTDERQRERRYTLADLEAGGLATPGRPAGPLSYITDRRGRSYVVGKTGPVTIWQDATQIGRLDVDAFFVKPSPRGDRFALSTRDRGIAVVDADGTPRWQLADQAWNGMAWSPDGAHLAIGGFAGGLIVDGATGATVMARCGLVFTMATELPGGRLPERPPLCRP